MEDENHEPTNTQNTPPASNQNLIIGIVMGAVVLLLLLLIITQQLGKGSSKGNPEVAELRKKIEAEREANDKRRLASITGVTASPDALVDQIKSDTEALARLVNANAGDAAALRTAKADAATLFRANQDLTNQLTSARAAAQRADSLQRQLDELRRSAAGMVSQSEVGQLQSELELTKGERDRIQAELTLLRSQQQGMIAPSRLTDLQKELDDLYASNATLRRENQRLITELAGAKLFVTEEDLSPRAVALYRELKKIEDQDHRKRRDTYTLLNDQINAKVQESISFKTGSAEIAREHEAHLKDMAIQATPKSFFLVVGYASKSGDLQSNEELSSKRATRVASMVNYLKKEGQAVQAVYLGEGIRFGPEDAPNQVCEVWEIRP